MLAAWQANAIEDLSPFCDLGTAPEYEASTAQLDVLIRRNDRDFRLELRQGPGGLMARPEGGSAVTFGSLLSSPEFGELDRMASQIGILSNMRRSQTRKEVKGRAVYTYDWYVDSLLSAERPGWGPRSGRADHLLEEVVREGAQTPDLTEATDLVFLTAQAGQGKSSTLRWFHQQQAQRYLRRQTQRLTFYVDAQGRGLTNLADVLARELNELRINLPHNAILSLVRRGLITLIIDGFDELVGARGTYEGAFASLTTFLELLSGRGQVIAAARSAFFTEEYLARPFALTGETGSHQVTRLELAPWTPSDRAAFLDRARESSPVGFISKSVEAHFLEIQESDRSDLLTRPLFSRDVLIATIVGGRSVNATSDLALVSTIAENYIEREVTEKLLAPGRLSILTTDQLSTFFEDLAAEMWSLETRELDLPTVRTLMDLRCDEWAIDPTSRRIVLDRVGTLPFLIPGTEGQHTVLFEHEIFFSFFLSSTLATDIFGKGPGAQSALARARLSPDDASLLVERFLANGADIQVGLKVLLEIAEKRHPRQGQIQINCGSLTAAMLRLASRDQTLRNIRVASMSFDGDSFRGVRLESVAFEGCMFNRVDLRDARMSGHAASTDFLAALVDEVTTVINLSGLDPDLPIVQVERVVDGRSAPVYDTNERDRLLRATGFALEGSPQRRRFEVEDEVLFVVTQLCRAFDEMNPVGERHTKYLAVFSSPAWPRVREALIESEMVKSTTKASSGPKQNFYRKRFQTSELLAALHTESTNDSIERFWRSVAKDGGDDRSR